MHVLFDCRYVKDGARDGISRFTIELARHLGELADVTLLVSNTDQLRHLPNLPHVVGPSQVGVLEPLTSWRLRRVEADVLFSPMQTIGTRGRRWPVVVTIHDLIYYRHPTPPRDLPAFVRGLWRLYHRAFWPQRMLLRGSDGIVTVSESTAAVMRTNRLDVRPVGVVHNAAAPLGEPVSASRPERKRVVYMGSFMPYKNVDTLVRTVALLPDYELVVLARVSERERKRLAAIAPDARLVFLNGVTDEEYADCLRSSTALVSASREEGFGIPLLESLALGVPVVVSDIDIFHEVAGDAGLYANPDDPEDFAARIRALESHELWEEKSRAGRARARSFSWSDSAKALHDFLEQTRRDWRA